MARIGLSFLIYSLLLIAIISCESFLEVDPPKSKIFRSSVFASESSADLAVIGIYSSLLDNVSFASGDASSLTALCGLSADELVNKPRNVPYILEFEENDLSAINSNVLSLWTSAYKTIYMANAVIEGLSASSIDAEVRNNLLGEVYFMRAFCHFYLINLFGDVPLVTSTDYSTNSKLERTATYKIYESIIDDLTRAEILLNTEYSSEGRTRVNKESAIALLARVYLYTNKWDKAEQKATEVINNSMYELTNLNEVFLANSKEAIWQLRPSQTVTEKGATSEAVMFTPPQVLLNNVLRVELVSSFEANDNRFSSWVGKFNAVYHPSKYKQNSINGALTEYSMIIRLAELYLIRAEARAWLGSLIGSNSAQSDINEIRDRAGLSNTLAVTFDELILAVEKERRVELFTEWGHRWFDLKRTGRVDAILDPIKARWNSSDQLYPIPQDERNKNPNLNPQNPGY